MAIEKFSKDHEWIRVEGDIATIGITVHAQDQLGDVVFVEVPEVGRKVSAEEAVAVVESVKAASDVYSPVTGEVIEANGDLAATPGLVNEDAEGKAWFFKVRLAKPAELDALMDRAAYDDFAKNG
ncbi:glycine cleavage system protein GcvH [Hyphomicrobium sp. CS1BSMeth3]|uniref:glycine cleavage system protein GcvH n=1 Tax=Hyphomicrobium sp. CS1BSMeth3 TaxID=1892844 RepID=UPI00093021A4|nr:glycine cleavage system protein GcvH [Hyphomicrobium sp. CS1BSMeth3]